MPHIFISYRRSDTQLTAERLREALAGRLGPDTVFRDQENIPGGVAWRKCIDAALGEGTVVLALVGSTWVSNRHASGARIIDDPANHNRQEIETALQRQRLVIPVVVDDATMPGADELPPSLREFAGLQARKLRADAWPGDIDRLVKELGTHGFAATAGRSHGPADTGDQRRRLIVWAALIVVVALAAAAIWYFRDGSPPPAVTSSGPYFEIVFDRSNLMAQSFEGRPKLDHAKRAVLAALASMSEKDNIAWREFGGTCDVDDGYTLPFAAGTGRVKDRVTSIESTSGRSKLVDAVIAATGDFNELPHTGLRAATLLVVTAGFGECRMDDDEAAATIRARMATYPNVDLDLRFVGVGLAPEVQARLDRFAKATGGTITNVLTPTQLSTAFVQALVIQPKLSDVREVVATLDAVSKDVNAAIASIRGSDLAAAARALADADRAFAGSELPMAELQQPADVRSLITLARESQNEQRKMLNAVRDLIGRSQAEDADGVAAATRAYNAASTANNEHLREIDTLQNRMVSGLD